MTRMQRGVCSDSALVDGKVINRRQSNQHGSGASTSPIRFRGRSYMWFCEMGQDGSGLLKSANKEVAFAAGRGRR